MLLPITRQHLTHPISRPALRDAVRYRLTEVRAIVMHWTANTGRGANAMANRNYFNLGSRHASAHYVVDDRMVVQCLPHDEVAYHVGAKSYRPDGRALMGGTRLGPNHWTIGIEMCVNSDGDWDKTYLHSVGLAAWLCARYPNARLLRHFDITGKDCPKMMIEDQPWKDFTGAVESQKQSLLAQFIWRVESRVDNLNIRSGPGMEHKPVGTLHKGEPVIIFRQEGNWCEVEPGGWCHLNFLDGYTTN